MAARDNYLLCLCFWLGLVASPGLAQQPDSARAAQPESVAMQQFLAAVGPAEAVFSIITPPPYRFRSGSYTIGNSAFPLLNSPDSLVQLPIERAYKQRRRARISAIATAVPLVVLAYSATRLVLTLGSVVTGRPSSAGLPDGNVIRVSGITAVAGITITSTFNIASMINLRKGVKRHNALFGRRYPTIFNPKGL